MTIDHFERGGRYQQVVIGAIVDVEVLSIIEFNSEYWKVRIRYSQHEKNKTYEDVVSVSVADFKNWTQLGNSG